MWGPPEGDTGYPEILYGTFNIINHRSKFLTPKKTGIQNQLMAKGLRKIMKLSLKGIQNIFNARLNVIQGLTKLYLLILTEKKVKGWRKTKQLK